MSRIGHLHVAIEKLSKNQLFLISLENRRNHAMANRKWQNVAHVKTFKIKLCEKSVSGDFHPEND